MSVTTDIYDLIEAAILDVLPGAKQLNNPYFPEEDAVLSYDTGYGITFGDGSGSEDTSGIGQSVASRTFTVIQTKRKFATARDKAASVTTAKDLMDDWTLFKNKIEGDATLGNHNIVKKAFYVSDSGIEFLTLDKKRNSILMISTVIQVNYHESVGINGNGC